MIHVKEFPFAIILILLVCVFDSSTEARYIDYDPIRRGNGDHLRVYVPIPANPYCRGCEASQRCRQCTESLVHNFWNYFLENNVKTG